MLHLDVLIQLMLIINDISSAFFLFLVYLASDNQIYLIPDKQVHYQFATNSEPN